MNTRAQRRPTGFTLIELLLVVVIIAVVAGLVLSALSAARARAKAMRAQVDCRAFADCFRAFYNDYSRWPVATSGVTMVSTQIDALVYRIFRGSNSAMRIYFKAGTINVDSTGKPVDPWNGSFFAQLDMTEANSLPDPFGSTTNFSTDVMVWSAGPDGQWTNANSNLNKDNVKSW